MKNKLLTLGLALLLVGCGSDSNSPNFSPVAPGIPPQAAAQVRGRGGLPLDPQTVKENFRALDPDLDPQLGKAAVTSFLINGLPPVQDQGYVSSCGSFGCGYFVGSRTGAGGGSRLDFQLPQNQASPAWLYSAVLKLENQTTTGGTYIVDYLKILTEWGARSFAEVPYPDPNFSDAESSRILLKINADPATQAETRFQIGGYAQIKGSNNSAVLEGMKKHLALDSPVPFSVALPTNFSQFIGSGVFVGAAPTTDYHIMCAIGFDDTKAYIDKQGVARTGALLVQNSWGTTAWGDKGRGWIAYATMEECLDGAFAVHRIARDAVDASGCTLNSTVPAVITHSGQGKLNSENFLIFKYQLSEPLHLNTLSIKAPRGQVSTQKLHGAVARTGNLFLGRLDGHRFPAGNYVLTLKAQQRNGAAVTLSGTVTVADLASGQPASWPSSQIGTDGQPIQ